MAWVTAFSAFGRLSVTIPAAPRRSNRISPTLTATSIERREIGGNREHTERAAAPMQPPPLHDQTPRLLGCLRRRRCLQHAIGRHDDEHRIGPWRENKRCTEKPAPIIRQEKCGNTKQSRQDREARLHDSAAFVTRLPL